MARSKSKKSPPEKSRASKKGRPTKKRGVRRTLVRLVATCALWGLIALGVVIGWHAVHLPDLANLDDAAHRQAVVRVLAEDGTPLARYGGLHGKAHHVRSLPPYVLQAVLATEDRRFYDHFGIDLIGIGRALVRNLAAGRIRQGGSTITQQLAKNLFLTQERTIGRKIRETLLALWLERRFTKEQILTIYLNRVYLGAGVYGIDAASRTYFGKGADKLTLYEAAVIAGLLKAPTRYNPATHPERAADRANQVLLNMADAGWLDEAKARKAFRERVRTVRRRDTSLDVRYFTDWVLGRVNGLVGYIGTDLTIRTTLDPVLQRRAEAAVRDVLKGAGKRNVSQAAFVAMTPDGAVRAMVGGADYGRSQFNRATQALRQPGSVFKLFVYLAGLEKGLEPGDEVHDAPVEIKGWRPRNYSRQHRGSMTLREGAARSSNAVAVAVAEQAGRRKVVQAARRLGVTSELGLDPSLALGVYEMTLFELVSAYAVIAHEGYGVWPRGIAEIRDGTGDVIYSRPEERPPRLVAARHVGDLNDLLHAVVSWGTGRGAKMARPAAGKTGTSQGNRDAWFIGYTRDMAAGVWMGNDDASPMKGVTGGSLPAALWKRIMLEAHRDRPVRGLPGIVSGVSAAD